jgi:phosphatidylglycerol:prolipoprotein diacylglycerol transferase
MVAPGAARKVDSSGRRRQSRPMLSAAIPFPDIRPEVFSVDLGGVTLSLRWYALAYIAGLLVGWRIVLALVRRPALWPGARAPMTPEAVEELLTGAVIGVIVGGRLGYVLFYQPAAYLADPLAILRIWEGGMAFHGGFLGVVAAAAIVARRHRIPALSLADALALATPPGLFFGRLANFVNAELWGRPTLAPWGVIFPGAAAQDCGPDWPLPCARHPSQLYEAGLEGLLLGALLAALAARGALRRPGLVAGTFFAGYGLARAFVELFRQADAQFITPANPLGHVVRLTDTIGLSMGQVLSLPMIAAGLLCIALALRRA